ncbi:MAG TPA: hypothetical protein VE870_00930, partial [Bacteroidales bacterium]|nr:hypothetical protein [Bacteroidales bacterium]
MKQTQKKTIWNIAALMIFFTALIVSSCNQGRTNEVLKAADYGLAEDGDATPLIRSLMDSCRILGISELDLPRGTYHFYPYKADEEYCAISNNDNGLKRIAFLIENMSDFHLKGDSTRLIFHGNMVPVVIKNSKHIKLSGFSIDWQRPFQSEAEVTDVNPSNQTFDIRIALQFPYEIQSQELLFKGEGWIQDIQKNLFFDPGTGATVYKVNQYKLDPWNPLLRTEYSAWDIAPGVVRIYDTISPLPKKGWIWVSKGGKEPSRYSPAIWLYKAINIDVNGISIYNSGGMGLIAERSRDITMQNMTITPSPGSGRIVSTSADATHFISCKGTIRFDHCLFESMLDDATNVHGIYTIFKGFSDKHTIGVQTMHYQQHGFDFAEAGDTLQFTDRNTLLPYLSLKVRKVTRVNEEYTLLEFNEDVTGLIKANTAVENLSWYPDVIMKNCTVRKNRARSIL